MAALKAAFQQLALNRISVTSMMAFVISITLVWWFRIGEIWVFLALRRVSVIEVLEDWGNDDDSVVHPAFFCVTLMDIWSKLVAYLFITSWISWVRSRDSFHQLCKDQLLFTEVMKDLYPSRRPSRRTLRRSWAETPKTNWINKNFDAQ